MKKIFSYPIFRNKKIIFFAVLFFVVFILSLAPTKTNITYGDCTPTSIWDLDAPTWCRCLNGICTMYHVTDEFWVELTGGGGAWCTKDSECQPAATTPAPTPTTPPAGTVTGPAGPTGGLVPCHPTCDEEGNCTEQCTVCDFFQMLANIYDFIVKMIATPLAIVALTIGGIFILISAGNPNLLGTGKKILYAAIIGLVLVWCSWLIINFILTTIGYSQSWFSMQLDCSGGVSGGAH